MVSYMELLFFSGGGGGGYLNFSEVLQSYLYYFQYKKRHVGLLVDATAAAMLKQ